MAVTHPQLDVWADPAPTSSPKRLHLGCGKTIVEGWVNLDCVEGPGVDVVADLDRCRTDPLPFENDTFDEVHASHLIEHIRDALPMMQELHRVCKHGATMVVRCPHGGSDDAFEDPTHFRQYFPKSFIYFSQPAYWRADYGYRGDWQLTKVRYVVKSENRNLDLVELAWRIDHLRNMVQELVVVLQAVKPIRPQQRELLSWPAPEVFFID